jgi:predicted RNA-binding Zn ribbon-like protein
MDFIGYRSDALGAAVELVNEVTAPRPAEPACELRDLLLRHGYLVGNAPKSMEEQLRAWARRLRTVFEVSDADEGAVAVNALLADVEIEPHLSNHDDRPWHLHYSPPQAGVLARVRSTTAFALAMLVSEFGVQRHGHCAAEGCARVYADTSRNATRRYCSDSCANRSAVAAHRARRRTADEAQRPATAR